MADCNTSTLQTYIPGQEKPWNDSRVKHLYNRLGYGANKKDITEALAQEPVEMINKMFDDAYAKPLMAEPFWANYTPDQFLEENGTAHYQLYNNFVTDFVNEGVRDPVREKIVLFWSNVLVVKFESYYYSPYLYQYHRLLEKNALGNFRTMIRELGLNNGMLIFLGGVYNHKWDPNENYARELLELFTLGLDNGYTEEDIREIARAFTGFNNFDYDNMTIEYNPGSHDDEDKTIFGVTANFDYNGVIDLLFEQKAELIARHTCRKIYAHFVNFEVNEEIVNELAEILLENDFELLPVFKKLFTSEHFFDENAFNLKIKSHGEYFTTFLKQFDITLDYESGNSFNWFCASLGQAYFDPLDVAGWKENKTWVDSGSLLVRWLYTEWMVTSYLWENKDKMIAYLKDITNDSNDVEYVVRTLTDVFLVNGVVTQSDYNNLLVVFKADLPENYYTEGLWNLDWDPNFVIGAQMISFFRELRKLPDFALS